MQEGWRATIPVNEPLPHLQRRLPLEIVSLVCMPGGDGGYLALFSSPRLLGARFTSERWAAAVSGTSCMEDAFRDAGGLLVYACMHPCMDPVCAHDRCNAAQSRRCRWRRKGGIHNYTELRSTSGLLGGGSRNVFAGWGERFPGVIRRDSDVKREHLCLHGLDASEGY